MSIIIAMAVSAFVAGLVGAGIGFHNRTKVDGLVTALEKISQDYPHRYGWDQTGYDYKPMGGAEAQGIARSALSEWMN